MANVFGWALLQCARLLDHKLCGCPEVTTLQHQWTYSSAFPSPGQRRLELCFAVTPHFNTGVVVISPTRRLLCLFRPLCPECSNWVIRSLGANKPGPFGIQVLKHSRHAMLKWVESGCVFYLIPLHSTYIHGCGLGLGPRTHSRGASLLSGSLQALGKCHRCSDDKLQLLPSAGQRHASQTWGPPNWVARRQGWTPKMDLGCPFGFPLKPTKTSDFGFCCAVPLWLSSAKRLPSKT